MGSASRDCCSLQTVSDQRLSKRWSNERLPGTLSARAMTGCRLKGPWKLASTSYASSPASYYVQLIRTNKPFRPAAGLLVGGAPIQGAPPVGA